VLWPEGGLLVGAARRRGWRGSLVAAGWLAVATVGHALANPTGGVVAAGSATISAPAPGTVAVTQHSQRAIVDWQSFSIGSGETTEFIQPNSGAFILNRVLGGDPSLIAGHLIANGNIAIVNGAGILFLNGSVVDVNSLVATPADIANTDFMAGRFNFVIPSANPNATVVNEGHISIKDHGLAALVAPGVQNSGVIEAKFGKVVLGGAQTFTVDFYGDGLINFDVGSKPAAALVANSGRITADGGKILLSADAADAIVSDVVTGGTLEAHSVGAETGTIAISGGTVRVGGTVDASGRRSGETGGTVEVTGTNVAVTARANIDASGQAGGGTVLVGGDFHGAGPLPNATDTTIAAGASIEADALASGNGGKIAVWANDNTVFAGTISTKGGSAGGNGGYVETSGGAITLAGTVNTGAVAGATGTWLIDPDTLVIGTSLAATISASTTNVAVEASGDITLSSDLTPNAGVSLGLAAGGDIALGANIDFSAHADTTGNLFLTAAGAITQTAGAITMDGGTASLVAGTGIGTSLAPIATAGVTTVAATATSGGIFLTNAASGNVVAGASAGVTLTAGTSPTTTPALDDLGSTIEESNGGTGANSLVITTQDLFGTAVTFSAGSGLSAAGDTLLANAAGDVMVGRQVDTTGSITLSASGNLDIEATVGASATGTITLSADSGASGTGLLTVNGAVGNASAGDITLSAATITIAATVEGGGALTLSPSTAGSSIAVGSSAIGTYALPGTSLRNLGSGSGIGGGFTAITIGRADGTGVIDVDDAATLSFMAPLTLESNGAGGSITVAGRVSGAAGLTLEAGGTASLTAISIGAAMTATDDVGLVALTGNIVVSDTVTGANVLLSAAGGAVTESGGSVTATDLLVLAANASALNGSDNSVSVLAADVTSGGFAFTNGGDFVVGSASVSPPGIATAAVSGVTASGDVGIVATAGTLTLTGSVSGADVLLSAANGAVTESGGTVSATDLVVKAKLATALNGANSIAVLGADVTNAGFGLTNAGSFAAGAASISPPGVTTAVVNGVTASGDVGLVSTSGTVTLSQSVLGDNVLLSATAGAVTEIGAGVTAADLIVLAANDSALNGSNSISTVAAAVTSGGFALTNGSGFAVDAASVTPPGQSATAQSVVAATGDIGLVATSGKLTLNQSVSGANVLLSAPAGQVTQSGGILDAGDLIVLAANDSVLNGSGNNVSLLAADVTAGGFAFSNSSGLAVGTASVSPPGSGSATTQNGISALGDVGLTASAGDITLSKGVSGANVLLSATAGAVTESGGAVSAGDLIVLAANDSALAAANGVSVVAADVTAGGLEFVSAGSLAVNSASVNPASLGTTSQNKVAAAGDVGLVSSSGNLTLDQNVTGANVLLSATAGTVIESGGGVGATDLIVRAANDTALNSAANAIGLLGARVSAGGFAFTNASGFTVGAASVNPASAGATTQNGVSATSDSALVAAAGDIAIARAINVGSANLLLHAAGAVSETGTGAVTAGGLLLRAGASADLANANDVGTLAARYGTGFALENGATLTVGAVSVSAPGISDATNNTGVGDGSSTSDVALVVTSGSLTLTDGVDVGTHNLLLASDTSSVGGTGAITASGLVLVMSGDEALSGSYARIGASITGGGFAYTGSSPYDAGVTVNSPALGGTFGVAATGDVGLIATAGALTLKEAVSGANVLLDAPAGAVTESGGAVTGGGLIVEASASSALNAANNVSVLAANITGGGFGFTNSRSFSVNEVIVSPPALGAVTLNAVTANGDVGLLSSSGSIALAENVVATNVLLSAASGGVNETGGVVLANAGAGDLVVLAGSDSALEGANNVGTLGAAVTIGGIAFTDLAGLTVGAASVTAPGMGTVVQNGVSAGADVGLVSEFGNLTIAKTITGAGAILAAPFGAVTETTGSIALGTGTGSLLVTADGDSSLTNAGNSIGVLAADIGFGALSFTNASGFSIGSVSLSIPAIVIAGASPITSSFAGVEVATNVALDAKTGNITQSSSILANSAQIEADGTGASIALNNASNDVLGAIALDTASASGNASITNDSVFGTTLAGSLVGGSLTVTAATGDIFESGNITSGGTLALKASAGSIFVETTLQSGSSNIFLEADGAGASIISAGGSLTLGGAGNVSLVANAGIGAPGPSAFVPLMGEGGILTLSAKTTVGGIYIASTDALGTTLGPQAPPPAGFGAIGSDGTEAAVGDIGIKTVGPLALAAPVKGETGSVYLEADGVSGAITSSGGAIDLAGGVLSLVASAGVGASATPIAVVDASPLTIAGETASGGFFVKTSSSGAGATVTIGSATPPAYFDTTAVNGISTTASGDVGLENAGGTSGGSIVLGSGISAAGNVFLEADGSGATITSSGNAIALGGSELSLVATAGVGTAGTPIDVVDAAPLTVAGAASTGGFALRLTSPDLDGAALAIGDVSPPGFFASDPLEGVAVATSGNVAIENSGGALTGGPITLARDLNLSGNATGNVFLEADGSGATITGAPGAAIRLAGGELSLVAAAGVGTTAVPVAVIDGSPLTLAGSTVTGGFFVSTAGPATTGAAITIGAVSPPDWFVTNSVSGVATASSGSVGIENAGGSASGGLIVLADKIASAGKVFLEADAAGAQIVTSGGEIALPSGAGLSLWASGQVGAPATPIDVLSGGTLTLAGGAGAGGWYVSTSSSGLFGAAVTIGAPGPQPEFFEHGAVAGITDLAGGTIALKNTGGLLGGGSIALASTIGATGVVFLNASAPGGQIIASGGVVALTGGGLSLVAGAGVGSAAAPIEITDGSALTLAGATVTGGFYVELSNTAPAGGSLTIGSLTPPAFFLAAPVSGVTVTASGDIALRDAGGTGASATGGAIVLVDAVSAAGSVFLESDKTGATIAQMGGSILLSGGGLSLVATRGVGSAIEPIRVSDIDPLTLAGAAATGGWYVSASSPSLLGAAVTVGALVEPTFFSSATIAGITVGSGDIALQNAGGVFIGGSIVLANAVSGGGNVFLEADGLGSTIIGAGGAIEPSGSGTLSLFANAGIGTSTSAIEISDPSALTLAAETTSGGIYLAASDAEGVTVGHAAGAPGFFASGASGLASLSSAVDGDVALQNASGSITLASSINLGASPGSVYLEADGAGARIVSSGSTIDLAGGGLSLVAGAGVGRSSVPLRVLDASPLTIAGATGTGGWYVSVASPAPAGAALTIGTLAPPAFFASTPVAGLTVATSGAVALQNLGGASGGGSIVLASNITLSSDTGGSVFLEADGMGAAIIAGGGTIDLDGTNLALIAENGIGTSAAPIVTSDAGAMTVAATTFSGGVFLSDASPGTNGAAVTIGNVATPGFFTTPLVSGISSPAGGNVTLANAGGSVKGGGITIAAPITLNAASGVLALDATAPIVQTGGAITTNVLTLAAGGSASLTMSNSIASLGTVSLTATGDGDFVLQNTGDLSLVGSVSVADGAVAIATSGTMTVAGGIAYTSSGHIGLGSASFVETGSFIVAGAPSLVIDATGLSATQLDAITVTSASEAIALPLGPGIGGSPSIKFGGLEASGSALLISVTGASVTGTVNVGGLGVSGTGDIIDLFGSIAGDSSEFAAILAVRAGGPDNSARFNSCAIGSPACVVEPILVPVVPPSTSNLDILTLPVPLDPLDIDRLDTGNEDDL